MEPFQSVQKTLTTLGINQNRNAFIDRVLIAYYVFCSSSILSCVFFFTEAESFREYMDSIYTVTANIAVTFCFTYIIIKMDQLFQYIDDSQKIVYCRKWSFSFRINTHFSRLIQSKYLFRIGIEGDLRRIYRAVRKME